MNRIRSSLLVLALASFAGFVSAQSYDPYRGAPPVADRYGQAQGAHYDYARVVRVAPVIGDDGYARESQRCYTRRDGIHAGGDRYRGDGYGDPGDGYRGDAYRRDDDYGGGRSENGRTIATVLGGIAGAVLGSRIGDGSGQYIGTAVGSMVGGIAGREIYDANRRNQVRRDGTVTVCDPVREGDYLPAGGRGVSWYDVTYEYAGREYVTRTDHHPGDRIRVRVDVRPE